MKLSILICTIPSRFAMIGRLKSELWSQMLPHAPEIEVRIHDSADYPIGRKRNDLLGAAKGEYVCFIDDDDQVSKDYIDLLMKAVESGMDCASLRGSYYVDGIFDGDFEHSIKYHKWETVNGEIRYLRYPNHLSMIKSSIAKQFKFPEINHGEDEDWSTQIYKSGLIKTEFYIPTVIYHYYKVTNKKLTNGLQSKR